MEIQLNLHTNMDNHNKNNLLVVLLQILHVTPVIKIDGCIIGSQWVQSRQVPLYLSHWSISLILDHHTSEKEGLVHPVCTHSISKL